MRVIVLSAAIALISCIAPLVAQPLATLSQKDIADAIRLGTFGEPRPYVLHGPSLDPTRRNSFELAAVYTPFVRVALATRAARDAGHVLIPDDLDQQLLEPLVYFAFRWVGTDTLYPGSAYAPPQVYWIFTRDIGRMPMPQRGLDPLWVKRGDESAVLLASFGEHRPYDDIALVAAFPVKMLRTDGQFIVYRKLLSKSATPPHPVEMVTGGEILPDDLSHWR